MSIFEESAPLSGTVYLPLCFICNKRWTSRTKHKPESVCNSCYYLPSGVFNKMYESALQRKEEMKYKKD